MNVCARCCFARDGHGALALERAIERAGRMTEYYYCFEVFGVDLQCAMRGDNTQEMKIKRIESTER